VDGVLLIADVGDSGPARDVIDGYATLFAEAHAQAAYDFVLVPVGVGSLAAAAARHGAETGRPVIGVEPVTAADCAEVSPAAWPSLRAGIHGTVTVDDAEVAAARAELAAAGLAIGESGAAPLAALRRLMTDPEAEPLRRVTGARPLLIATEGPTGAR
jgi:diaminopropionate ammonia-lyase